MKNLLYILKQTGNQTPDNYTNTTVEFTVIGLLFIGFIIGVILTLCIFGLIKILKNKPDNNDNNNTNNDINNDTQN